eukprot:1696618-Rhodomonas_salina.5
MWPQAPERRGKKNNKHGEDVLARSGSLLPHTADALPSCGHIAHHCQFMNMMMIAAAYQRLHFDHHLPLDERSRHDGGQVRPILRLRGWRRYVFELALTPRLVCVPVLTPHARLFSLVVRLLAAFPRRLFRHRPFRHLLP